MMNHRDAGAFERKAPAEKEFLEQQAQSQESGVSTDDILVVVSKVKAYIRTRSGLNTSDSVMKVLSDRIRAYSDQAIRSAEANGRKTVMERDFS
jgi:hypothetical protein